MTKTYLRDKDLEGQLVDERIKNLVLKIKDLELQFPQLSFKILRILWEENEGFTRYDAGYGYIQHTIRPYTLGYGCDGTTDNCIHLLATTLCIRTGIDYKQIYLKAYGHNGEHPVRKKSYDPRWIDELHEKVGDETHIPKIIDSKLVLSDLYDINNRTLSWVLEKALKAVNIGSAIE